MRGGSVTSSPGALDLAGDLGRPLAVERRRHPLAALAAATSKELGAGGDLGQLASAGAVVEIAGAVLAVLALDRG